MRSRPRRGEKNDLNIAAGRTGGLEQGGGERGAEGGKMLAEDRAGFQFEQSVSRSRKDQVIMHGQKKREAKERPLVFFHIAMLIYLYVLRDLEKLLS